MLPLPERPLPSEPAPIALGCMNFGKRTARAEALSIVDRALDAGVVVFDTANAYNDGASEEILGAAVRGRRDRFFLATKVGFARIDGRPEGLSPDHVRRACDASRKRLGTDVIDLYYLHVPDRSTPIRATLEAVAGLVDAGAIREWGVSNYASWEVLEMRGIAAEIGLPPPAVAQQLYNPLIRQLDVEWWRFTERFPIHTTVYNPLAGGLLAGNRTRGDAPRGSRFDRNPLYQRRYWTDAMFDATDALHRVASEHGRSLLELAYGFAFRHPGVGSVLVGPGDVAQLDAAIAARDLPLPDGADVAMLQVYRDLTGTDASYAR
jgi:aryl-alcohol dehydrogenase-like predicted oxidoreductase